MTGVEAAWSAQQHLMRCPSPSDRNAWHVTRWHLPGKWMLKAKDVAGREWVFKFAVNHGGRAPETCRRELLISLLGQAIAIPVVDAWVVESTGLLDLVHQPHQELITDHVVLMPLLAGVEADKSRDAVKATVLESPSAIANLFAFMHWVGDDDRSLFDVMLVGDQLVLIDNGLCGPGRDHRIRSYHPMPDTNPARLILKCYGGGKPSLVEFVLRDCALPGNLLLEPDVIRRIESISDDAVDRLTRGSGVEGWVAGVLNARKRTLKADYLCWLAQAISVTGI